MPSKPTIPLYPPQGIQAELDLVYLYNADAMKSVQEALDNLDAKADKAQETADDALERTKDNKESIDALEKRAEKDEADIEANAAAIAAEKERAEDAEAALDQKIIAETARAKSAEATLQSSVEENAANIATNKAAIAKNAADIATLQTTSAQHTDDINSLKGRMTTAEGNIDSLQQMDTALQNEIDAIQEVIPTQASASNQLADKAFVNSTIQTATANFRGNWPTYAAIPSDIDSYPEDFAGSKTPTVNDYLVVENDETHENATWRYKYTGNWATEGKNGWEAEYKINDTPFTAAQLAAINSGITEDGVTQITTNKDNIAALQRDKLDKTEAASTYATKEELQGFENTASGTYATKNELATATADMETQTHASATYATKTALNSVNQQVETNTADISEALGQIAKLDYDKQNKLTAGDNITIEDNVISAAAGLPDQEGHTGYLQTNGTEASWSDAPAICETKETIYGIKWNKGDATSNSPMIVFGTYAGYQRALLISANRRQVGESDSVSIGARIGGSEYDSNVRAGAVAIGAGASAKTSYSSDTNAIAIGYMAVAGAKGAIQLGRGNNREPGTFQVSFNDYDGTITGKDYMLLNNDGLIPSDRLAADGTEGQVLTKTADAMEWKTFTVPEALPAMSDTTVGKYLTNDGDTAQWSTDEVLVNSTKKAGGLGIKGESYYDSVGIGSADIAGSNSVSIGFSSRVSGAFGYGTAIGYSAVAGNYATAIGVSANARSAYSIQLGPTPLGATAAQTYEFCVGFYNKANYKMLDGNTGLIPTARFANEGTDGQVLVKNGDYAEWEDNFEMIIREW